MIRPEYRVPRAAIVGLTLVLPLPLSAQIVVDGTLGPVGALPGPDFVIGDALGTQVERNLFHSFSDFNVNAGETATFTTQFAGPTDNVISRVTGAAASNIDGLLRSAIPGASFWFLNPNGVVFGADAAVDVPGAFHVTTADVLVLADGGRFDATNIGDTILTVADPVAFGFLDTSIGGISVTGAGLRVAEGEALSLIGGTVELSDASLTAPRGTIELQSAAGPGELGLQGQPPPGTVATALGSVRLSSSGLFTSGGSSGDVYIRSGEFFMEREALIEANTTGSGAGGETGDVSIEVTDASIAGGSQIRTGTSGGGDGGRITLAATGTVAIEGAGQAAEGGGGGNGGSGGSGGTGGTGGPGGGGGGGGTGGPGAGGGSGGGGTGGSANGAGGGGGGGGSGGGGDGTGGVPSNASGLFSDVRPGAGGAGGDIEVTANVIGISDMAGISAVTEGGGAAGDITLDAPQSITLTQEAQVNASTSSVAAAGNIRLAAPTVELLNGVRVGSVARAEGAGGNITIRAPEALIATGTNESSDPTMNRGTRITASSFFTATGHAGSIDVEAGTIELDDGARISTSTSGIGDGGSVQIVATGDITLTGARGDGSGSAIKSSTEVEPEEMDFVAAPRTGNAGFVSVTAPSLLLADGAEIVGNTALAGQGGQVVLDIGQLRITNARIASESTATGSDAGAAGAVELNADSIAIENGGRISAATIDGAGGTVTLHADSIRVVDGASVSAESSGAGRGGDLVLSARLIELVEDGTLSARGTGNGDAGALVVTADDLLTLRDSAIGTSAVTSAGGDIEILVGRQVLLVDASITAEAGGVTAEADGGNIFIDPDFVILNDADIIARANAGNGGNITVHTGFFVNSAESRIDASSSRGIDGVILIDSPNQITDSVLPLEAPVTQIDGLLMQPCLPQLAEQRSSLTVQERTTTIAAPGEFLASPLEPAAAAVIAQRQGAIVDGEQDVHRLPSITIPSGGRPGRCSLPARSPSS